MTKTERPFQNERQPRLPLTQTDKAINSHDARREARIPEQLLLIPQPQLILL